MDTHQFKPSRPGGTVCVAPRRPLPDDFMPNVCGYPAGHPIHAAAPELPDVEPGDTPHGRPGEPLFDINIARGVVAAYVPQEGEGLESFRAASDALRRLEAYVRRTGGAQQ